MKETQNRLSYFRQNPLGETSGVANRSNARLVTSVTDEHPVRLGTGAFCLDPQFNKSGMKLEIARFLDNTSIINLWLSPDARILHANAAACRLLGYSLEELLSKSIHDIDPCAAPSDWPDHWRRLKIKGALNSESKLQRNDGKLIPVAVTTNYMRFENEEYDVAFIMDISDRVGVEQALARSEERLRALTENIADIICIVDKEGILTYVSPSMQSVLGYSSHELRGKSCFSLLASSDISRIRRAFNIRLAAPDAVMGPIECKCRHKDEEKGWKYLSVLGRNRFHDPAISGFIIVVRDVTESKLIFDAARTLDARLIYQREQLLKLAQRKKTEFKQALFDALLIGSETLRINHASYWSGEDDSLVKCHMSVRDGRIETVNGDVTFLPKQYPEFARMLLKKSVYVFNEKDLANYSSSLGERLRELNIEAALTATIWVQGRVVGLICFSHFDQDRAWQPDELDFAASIAAQISLSIEGSKHYAAQERIKQLAHYDSLTGLPNRNLLRDRVKQALSHADRTMGSVAVMFLDLDRFKIINDTLGHSAGDSVLQQAANRLQAVLRGGDTLSRQGGDEFVVILPNIQSTKTAAVVAQKLVTALEAPFEIDGTALHIKTSIGVSIYPADGSDIDTLLRHADLAMYGAKKMGGNSYQFFTGSMNLRNANQLEMESGLRIALSKKELELYYQPQVDVFGRVVSIEALARWSHAKIGQIPPSEFIPLAEESDLIFLLSEWALEQACHQNKAWQNQGFPKVPIAVNLCARQFLVKTLPDMVAHVLESSGLEPQYLELEITESVLIQPDESTLDILHRLRNMGISLAIDDFGTGYSSLSYLKKYPIDKLKIDRSFILDLPDDLDDRAITRTIISMAHNLHLRVVAEGVETEKQLAFLEQHGCDYIQGYLFCHPVPGSMPDQLFMAGYQPNELLLHERNWPIRIEA